jgi:cytochrome P450
MIYLVCLHPEVEEKVRREIDEVVKEEDYSYENLKRCTYIDCIEKEVTRYYGPGFRIFDRFSERDTLLKDVPIKKGVLLSNPTIGFHYSEKYYRRPR